VPSGTLIFVLDGDPVPAGYTPVGSFEQSVAPIGSKKSVKTVIHIYKKI
jgi:hypothetical protein